MAYDSKSFANTIDSLRTTIVSSNQAQTANLAAINQSSLTMNKQLEKMSEAPVKEMALQTFLHWHGFGQQERSINLDKKHEKDRNKDQDAIKENTRQQHKKSLSVAESIEKHSIKQLALMGQLLSITIKSSSYLQGIHKYGLAKGKMDDYGSTQMEALDTWAMVRKSLPDFKKMRAAGITLPKSSFTVKGDDEDDEGSKSADQVEDKRDEEKKQTRMEKMFASIDKNIKGIAKGAATVAKGGLIAMLSAIGFTALIALFQSKTWKKVMKGIADITNWLLNDAGMFTKIGLGLVGLAVVFKPFRKLTAAVLGKLGLAIKTLVSLVFGMIKGTRGVPMMPPMGMGGGRGGGMGMGPMMMGGGGPANDNRPQRQPRGRGLRGIGQRMRGWGSKMMGKGRGGLLLGGGALALAYGGDLWDWATGGSDDDAKKDTGEWKDWDKYGIMPGTKPTKTVGESVAPSLSTLTTAGVAAATAAQIAKGRKPKDYKFTKSTPVTTPKPVTIPKAAAPKPVTIPKPPAGTTPKITGGGAGKVLDKFNHLKKFPMLLKAAKRVPILGPILASAGAIAIMNDPKTSTKQKKTELGKLVGGLIGSAGFAKLGGLAGLFGGPAAPVTATIGALVGGLAGWFGGEWAGEKLMGILMAEEKPDAVLGNLKGVDAGGVKKPNVPKVPLTDMTKTLPTGEIVARGKHDLFVAGETDAGKAKKWGKQLTKEKQKGEKLDQAAAAARAEQKKKQEVFMKEWGMKAEKDWDTGAVLGFSGKKEGWREAALKSGLFAELDVGENIAGLSSKGLKSAQTEADRAAYAQKERIAHTEARFHGAILGVDVKNKRKAGELLRSARGRRIGQRDSFRMSQWKLAKMEEAGIDVSGMSYAKAGPKGLVTTIRGRDLNADLIASEYQKFAQQYMPAGESSSHPNKDKKNLEQPPDAAAAMKALVNADDGPNKSLGVNVHNFDDPAVKEALGMQELMRFAEGQKEMGKKVSVSDNTYAAIDELRKRNPEAWKKAASMWGDMRKGKPITVAEEELKAMFNQKDEAGVPMKERPLDMAMLGMAVGDITLKKLKKAKIGRAVDTMSSKFMATAMEVRGSTDEELAEKLKADGMKPTPENIAKVRAAWDNYYHSEGAQTWLKDPRHNEKLIQKSIREAEKLRRGVALNMLAQTDGTEGAAAVPVNTQVNDNSSRQSVTNFTSHTSQVEDPRVNALAAGMSRF